MSVFVLGIGVVSLGLWLSVILILFHMQKKRLCHILGVLIISFCEIFLRSLPYCARLALHIRATPRYFSLASIDCLDGYTFIGLSGSDATSSTLTNPGSVPIYPPYCSTMDTLILNASRPCFLVDYIDW